MVQWLRLHAPNAGGPGLIPGLGTRSHMLQLRSLPAATKTWQNERRKEGKKERRKERKIGKKEGRKERKERKER